MKPALATIGLAMVLLHGRSAQAEQIFNTAFLSDFRVTAVPDTYTPNTFDIRFQGVFLLPVAPRGVAPSAVGIEYDFGIASWSENIPVNLYGGHLSGGAGWSFSKNSGWVDKYPGAFNANDGPLWQVAVSEKHGGTPIYNNELSASNPNAVNGQVPYYFHLELSITTPSSAPVSVEPSYLIYVGGLRALTYGDAVGGGPPPPGSGNGDVPVGSSSGLVWYLASTGSGGDAIPASLQAQLPGYIPTTISAIPEPATLALMAAGVIGISWRRRSASPAAAVGRSRLLAVRSPAPGKGQQRGA